MIATSRLIPLFILALAAGAARAEPSTAADPAGCTRDRIPSLVKQPKAAIAACDAALAITSDPKTRSVQFQLRAYARNEDEDALNAIGDLDEAVRLDPDNATALHERAYTLNVLGRWEEALRDIEAQLKLQPGNLEAYQERAFAEFPLGRFQDLRDDWTRILDQHPQDVGALRSRGKSDMWLGRLDDARADFDAADKAAQGDADELKRTAAEREKLSLWRDVSPGQTPETNCAAADEAATKDQEHAYREPHLVGDCSRAFLVGKTPKERAAALVVRAEAWIFLRNDEDDPAATEDTLIAVALEPDNPLRRSNLGFRYLGVHHSWAAIQQFDKSIAIQPAFYSYGGRTLPRRRYTIAKFLRAHSKTRRSLLKCSRTSWRSQCSATWR